ncbi:MAG: hypothetical protein EZS28_006191 [Streblomastix strix]|uniref:Aminoacyl-tRNA synthetase class Ia domain-containing protein n=1 Tax=Streblomastix strix TaxID=222440 RepID=A0A5J4WTZ6_9EUKA|nr:MAG: hypothetical protein EZS28_006191 [Streblomastix strix]
MVPFKNPIVNGEVFATNSEKMPKRLKNYPDPADIVNRHGADAFRLYLISSPAVHADNLAFKEEGVQENIRRKVKAVGSESSSSTQTAGNDVEDFLKRYEDEKDQLDSVHYSLIPKEMQIIARNESVKLEKIEENVQIEQNKDNTGILRAMNSIHRDTLLERQIREINSSFIEDSIRKCCYIHPQHRRKSYH